MLPKLWCSFPPLNSQLDYLIVISLDFDGRLLISVLKIHSLRVSEEEVTIKNWILSSVLIQSTIVNVMILMIGFLAM